MTQNLRFSVRDDEMTVAKGTLSVNGSFVDGNLLLGRLITHISTSNGSDLGILISPDAKRVNSLTNLTSDDDDLYDGSGAGIFVIAVVLVYGLSIVFMISSHLCMKTKMNSDADQRIDVYLNSAPRLRDESRRESFARLKRSLMPAIARSPSGRGLIEKRVKYTPYLLSYLPATGLSCGDFDTNSSDVFRPGGSAVGRDMGLMDRSKVRQQPDARSTDPDWSTTDISVFTSGGQTTGTSTRQDSNSSEHLQEVADINSNDKVSVSSVGDTRASVSREVSDANLSGDDSSVYCSAQSLQHV